MTITNDAQANEPSYNDWRISKVALASVLRVQLDLQQLRTNRAIGETAELLDGLVKFKPPSLAGGDVGVWREGAHDDLIFAVAIAGWRAQSYIPPNRKAMTRRAEEMRNDPYA